MTRPLTAQEKSVLGPLRDPFVTPLTGVLPGVCLGALIFVLGLGLLGFLPGDPGAGVPLVSALALASSAASYAMIQRSRRRGRQSDEARQDLSDGTATVTTFVATAAVALEEIEDEGLTYYLRLADGRVLLLSGQYLYGPVEAGTFPCGCFEVVRSRSGILLGLNPVGKPVPVISTREPRRGEFPPSGFPRDGAILDVAFEALR